MLSDVNALVWVSDSFARYGSIERRVRGERRFESRAVCTPFGSAVELRQLRRKPAVDAHGVRDRSAQRRRDCSGVIAATPSLREGERALGNRRDAREAPLLDLRGREAEALELRHRAVARLRHPARLRRSLLERAAVFGGVVRDAAGWPVFPVRRVVPSAASCLRVFVVTLTAARLRSSRSPFLRGAAPGPCRPIERCGHPAARARNRARCSSAGADSG